MMVMYLQLHNKTLNSSSEHICVRNCSFKTPFKMLLNLSGTKVGVGQSIQCQIKSYHSLGELQFTEYYKS